MKGLSESHGASLVGLDHRLKTEDSLARKIASISEKAGISADKAAGMVSDALRYTMVTDESHYVQAVNQVVADLRGQGWKAEVRNYWLKTNNPYQGVNVPLTSPDGQKIELQFHTPTSFQVKDGQMHSLYEQERVLKKDDPKKTDLNRQMADLASTIPAPPGIDKISI